MSYLENLIQSTNTFDLEICCLAKIFITDFVAVFILQKSHFKFKNTKKLSGDAHSQCNEYFYFQGTPTRFFDFNQNNPT